MVALISLLHSSALLLQWDADMLVHYVPGRLELFLITLKKESEVIVETPIRFLLVSGAVDDRTYSTLAL
jgi:hypothetical protein